MFIQLYKILILFFEQLLAMSLVENGWFKTLKMLKMRQRQGCRAPTPKGAGANADGGRRQLRLGRATTPTRSCANAAGAWRQRRRCWPPTPTQLGVNADGGGRQRRSGSSRLFAGTASCCGDEPAPARPLGRQRRHLPRPWQAPARQQSSSWPRAADLWHATAVQVHPVSCGW